ncbi:MAG: biotin/lipoyl-binding protein [Bacteroidales bacterium]|nr:biotin/lipoyl-binding protein [Bacteroidales bacterium]MBN2818251.1 biotin/lipoyl-binding protein [Bacteroidales bacterium]
MKRILIANRGEIAVRIIKTIHKLGKEAVAVYHADEEDAQHMQNADSAYCLGTGSLNETYLNIPKIIKIAKESGSDGVHPGYGFLSENYLFAKACEDNELVFIGPKSEVIRKMGSKSESKKIAELTGIPVLKSFTSSKDYFSDDAVFPLLIKAVSGGGGKGLKIARNRGEYDSALQSARREAKAYFGDDEVLVEPYLENSRHIEVQILGDKYGQVTHLFERECSIQRNRQKVIEEAPAVSVSEKLRNQLQTSAINFAKVLNYTNAGTVEFLVQGEKYFFLEMNTRIQVEHPVTEIITGIDIVAQQIYIAEGKPLSEEVLNASVSGHAIEARIYAEDPIKSFMPSTGKISLLRIPEQLRFDTFISENCGITPHFDAMLGKLIVLGENRSMAIKKMYQALHDTHIHGIKTNTQLLSQVIRDPDFADNKISTTYLENKLEYFKESLQKYDKQVAINALLIAFTIQNFFKPGNTETNLWERTGHFSSYNNLIATINGEDYKYRMYKLNENRFKFCRSETEFIIENPGITSNTITFNTNNTKYRLLFSVNDAFVYDNYELEGRVFRVSTPLILRMAKVFLLKQNVKSKSAVNQIRSPLFGKIVAIKVNKNQRVLKGDILMAVESMKTENNIVSPENGIVNEIFVEEGVQVKENFELITLNPV